MLLQEANWSCGIFSNSFQQSCVQSHRLLHCSFTNQITTWPGFRGMCNVVQIRGSIDRICHTRWFGVPSQSTFSPCSEWNIDWNRWFQSSGSGFVPVFPITINIYWIFIKITCLNAGVWLPGATFKAFPVAMALWALVEGLLSTKFVKNSENFTIDWLSHRPDHSQVV